MYRSLPARLGLACGLAAASVTFAGAAAAEEGVAFKNLMGTIGIIPKEKDPIPYRERAPLVIPPKTELRTPATSAAASNPEWPNDPDVAAKRRAADEQRRPVTWSETRRMSDNNTRMSVQELQKGRSATAEGHVTGLLQKDESARALTPNELAAKKLTDEDTPKLVGGEPVRKVLTDPPTGMRRSASGGPVKGDFAPRAADQQAVDASPMAWIRRKFTNDDED